MSDDIDDPLLGILPAEKEHPNPGVRGGHGSTGKGRPANRKEGLTYVDVDPVTGGELDYRDDGLIDPKYPREDGWVRRGHFWSVTAGSEAARQRSARMAEGRAVKREQRLAEQALAGTMRKAGLAATPKEQKSITKALRDLGLDVAAETLEGLDAEAIGRLARASVVLMLAGILSGEHEIKGGAKEAIQIADSCLKIARLEEGKTTDNLDDEAVRSNILKLVAKVRTGS